MSVMDRFFKIWHFLQDNPYADVVDANGKVITQGVKTKLTENSILNSDTAQLYANTLVMNPIYLSYPKDIPQMTAALEAREKTWKLFSNVLVPGSYAYNTKDMDLFRKMLIDWSSSSRALKDLFRRSTNAFGLNDEDVDKAIKGFGIDFVNQDTLDNTLQRQLFLLAMTDLYKIKGTPGSITKALTYAYVNNSVVREYWIERDPSYYKTLRIRGIACGKYQQRLDTTKDSPTENQYVFINNPDRYLDTLLSWQNFKSRLVDIAEPHWWYTNEEIIAIEFNPATKIKLPSKTPYFGIEYYVDIEKFNVLMGILEKILSDQLNSFISGQKNMIPQEIGVGGYNQDLTERDLWVTGFTQPVSMLECFLAFVYAQIRYDEYTQYKTFYDFLISHGVGVSDSYRYPWAVQELIYWAWIHRNDDVNGILTIDSILRMYSKEKSNYYCSTNELINWWLKRPLDPGETVAHYWNSSLDNNIPPIFFSTDYTFQYPIDRQDTTLDQILFYNGTRRLDYKQAPFEYFETLDDADRLLNTPTIRIPYEESFRSYFASNRHNPYLDIMSKAQADYRNTYFDYISWVSSDYLDHETHDGSSITPFYAGKYPKSNEWNWGVDGSYLYITPTPGSWIRVPYENVIDTTTDKEIGYQYISGNYIYKYISANTWIRYQVETSWPYCDSCITPDGHVKLTSELAHKTIKAKIKPEIAAQYIADKTQLHETVIDIILDPLGTNPQTQQYDVTELDNYIQRYNLTVDLNGYILEDFSYYFKDPYLYIRVVDTSNNVVWVRKIFETSWTSNGTKMYTGGYKWPNLDLTNRYDAERILRGYYVLKPEDLDTLTETQLTDIVTNYGGEILVCTTASGYPETWIYNNITETWSKNSINRINDINLGINNELINWIDASAANELGYQKYADKFLNALSSYVKIQFRDPQFDIAGIYKNIQNAGLHRNLINFFKPKRARLLYFSIDLEFDDRLFNSIIIDEELPTTKILQEINDHTARNDGIYIDDENGMYKTAYHESDVEEELIIPINSQYGRSVYYLSGFENQMVNGFYFLRSDLSQNGYEYYLNYHNIALTKVINDIEIFGYNTQWIIAARKDNLEWCDALYINYHEDIKSIRWVTKDYDPTNLSSSSSADYYVSGQVISVDDLTIDKVRPSDITRTVDDSLYNKGQINQWNHVHPRPEPLKTLREESQSLVHWTPALCKTPYIIPNPSSSSSSLSYILENINFRRVFPPTPSDWDGAGYPDSITGERVSDYDADDRNPGHQEFSYTFWRSNYPYSDDQLNIKDAAKPPIGIRTKAWNQLEAPSEYNAPYNYTYRTISGFTINSGGGGYSGSTTITLMGGSGGGAEVNLTISGGVIIGVNIIKGGIWFAAPTVYIYDITGIGAGASITANLGPVILTIPSWWLKNPVLYYSGPVHHRPVYIAIQNTINDCYPCIDLSGCCDYYDVGCRHDGPTNPRVVVWTPASLYLSSSSGWSGDGIWLEGQYSEYNLKDLNYDEFTHHHRINGFITNLNDIINPLAPPPQQITVREYWESENSWTDELTNPGDTYCTECDEPTFTPDLTYFSLPDEWKRCGIFHNSLLSSNFIGSNIWANDTWTPTSGTSTPILLPDENYSGRLDGVSNYTQFDFPYSYVSSTNDNLVHCYHKPSGYYYWELRKRINVLRFEWLTNVLPSNIQGWDLLWKTSMFSPIWNVIPDISVYQGTTDPISHYTDFTYDLNEDYWAAISGYPPTAFFLARLRYVGGGVGYILIFGFSLINGWTPILRSELKDKQHKLTDIIDENTGNWRVEQGYFLNANDIDAAEDDWADMNPIPSVQHPYAEVDSFIGKDKEDIPQVIVPGKFQPSTWVHFATLSYTKPSTSPYYQLKPGIIGELNFEKITGTTGNIYVCCVSDNITPTYLWRVVNNIEFNWTVGSESFIRPNSPNNHYGYYYRSGYLYLYIDTMQHMGWVRVPITATSPTLSVNEYFTSDWNFETLGDSYRLVSDANTFVNEDEMFVCGNMVPYNETYDGIRLILNNFICKCHVDEEVKISVFLFYDDPGGDYIKIRTTVPGPDGRREHRFLPKIFESQLTWPTDFSLIDVTSSDYYLLRYYIPLYLFNGVSKVTWEIIPGYYSKVELIDPHDWSDPHLLTPKISVTPLSYDYGNVEIFDNKTQGFIVQNIGGLTLNGTMTNIVPQFVSLTIPSTYSLGAGATKTIYVDFEPDNTIVYTDTLHFSGGGSQDVSVQGTGIALTVDARVTEVSEYRLMESSWGIRIVE